MLKGNDIYIYLYYTYIFNYSLSTILQHIFLHNVVSNVKIFHLQPSALKTKIFIFHIILL